jgi:hypothetical protein
MSKFTNEIGKLTFAFESAIGAAPPVATAMADFKAALQVYRNKQQPGLELNYVNALITFIMGVMLLPRAEQSQELSHALALREQFFAFTQKKAALAQKAQNGSNFIVRKIALKKFQNMVRDSGGNKGVQFVSAHNEKVHTKAIADIRNGIDETLQGMPGYADLDRAYDTLIRAGDAAGNLSDMHTTVMMNLSKALLPNG